MEIDLAKLREMHPRLPEDLARFLAIRAALGLERNGHGSPVAIHLEVERVMNHGLLAWPDCDLVSLDLHDRHQVTEYGAEAVALGLAHQSRGWQVVRRLQREERGDWLLEQSSDGQVVALEVSGVDHGSLAARLTEKLAQVALSADVDQRWASVVGFEEPAAALHSTEAVES